MLVIFAVTASFHTQAINFSEREYQIKAAFIANFIRYTRWDSPATQQFSFCTTSPSVNLILSQHLSDERWFGLSPNFTVVKPGQQHLCHFLFIDAQADSQWRSHLANRAVPNLLIVTEKKESARVLGQINFFQVDNKLRFEINPRRLEQAKLKVSASLLRLARIVSHDNKARAND